MEKKESSVFWWRRGGAGENLRLTAPCERVLGYVREKSLVCVGERSKSCYLETKPMLSAEETRISRLRQKGPAFLGLIVFGLCGGKYWRLSNRSHFMKLAQRATNGQEAQSFLRSSAEAEKTLEINFHPCSFKRNND